MSVAYADQAVEAAGQAVEAAGQAVEAAGQTAAAQPSLIESMIPMLILFGIFYFLMIRPQAKKAKDHADLLSALKPGDEVITSGGIIGRVRSVQEAFVTIDAGGSHLKIVKEHISRNTQELVSSAKAAKSAKAGAKAKSNA
ncbi:MAG: preprotein translocase subunit YajC [Zetaproteobacteria bacterium]|nr:preprotein translocase subunit YajC [Zetaproteobacteria bacterium]